MYGLSWIAEQRLDHRGRWVEFEKLEKELLFLIRVLRRLATIGTGSDRKIMPVDHERSTGSTNRGVSKLCFVLPLVNPVQEARNGTVFGKTERLNATQIGPRGNTEESGATRLISRQGVEGKHEKNSFYVGISPPGHKVPF
jgi:hypothetical protein